jgi:hypothetical protein
MSKHNLITIIEEKLSVEQKISVPMLQEQMQMELSGKEDFTERLRIVVNVIDNFFKLSKGEKLLTYKEVLKNAKRAHYKSFKARKFFKCKKI